MSLRVVSKKRSKNSHSIISNERIVYVSSNGYASFSLPLFVDIMGCCHSTPYMLGQQSQKKRREGARKTSSLSHAISEDKECMGNDSFQTLEEILGLEDFGKTHWASCNNSHKVFLFLSTNGFSK